MTARSVGRLCCILGTDTNVGKSVVTAALLKALTNLGVVAQAVKAVQSGCPLSPDGVLLSPDLAVYKEAAPLAPSGALVLLRPACSPALAAHLENRRLRIAPLRAAILQAAEKAEISLVEGSGGIFTPLNRKKNLLDLLTAPDAPAMPAISVLLVAVNRLGCINHTLLSLEALRARSLPAAAVILNHIAPPHPGTLEARIAEDNAAVIARMGRVPVLSLPYCAELAAGGIHTRQNWNYLAELLNPLARRILRPKQKKNEKPGIANGCSFRALHA